jgi:hypothetical protein
MWDQLTLNPDEEA